MNALVTIDTFDRGLDVGFNLPQADLKPNTAEQVSVIEIRSNQRLQIRWLSVHLVTLSASATKIPTKVNPSLGAVYAGLFGDRANFISAPAGRPLLYVPVELPGVGQSRPALVLDLSPGIYSILAVNNLQDTVADISVTGAWRVMT